jgi:hypothetical protein
VQQAPLGHSHAAGDEVAGGGALTDDIELIPGSGTVPERAHHRCFTGWNAGCVGCKLAAGTITAFK